MVEDASGRMKVREKLGCMSEGKPNHKAKNVLHGKIPVIGLFHTWCIDFADLLEETKMGNRYILLAIETYVSRVLQRSRNHRLPRLKELRSVWKPSSRFNLRQQQV